MTAARSKTAEKNKGPLSRPLNFGKHSIPISLPSSDQVGQNEDQRRESQAMIAATTIAARKENALNMVSKGTSFAIPFKIRCYFTETLAYRTLRNSEPHCL